MTKKSKVLELKKPAVNASDITRQEIENDTPGVLKGILKDAEAGEITGIAIVCLMTEKRVATVWTGTTHEDVFRTLGGINYLATRFTKEEIESLT